MRKHDQILKHAASSKDDNGNCLEGILKSDEHSWETLVAAVVRQLAIVLWENELN